MTVREYKERFVQDLRDAFEFVCDKYGTDFEKRHKDMFGLWKDGSIFHLQTIEPVVHIQDNVRYDQGGYRVIRWTRHHDRDQISICDVFRPVQKARLYDSTLYLVLKPTKTGVKTVARWHGKPWDWIRREDDASITYQGHPVDTGDQVVALLRNMDMACMQMHD